jgi:hypothetical protein
VLMPFRQQSARRASWGGLCSKKPGAVDATGLPVSGLVADAGAFGSEPPASIQPAIGLGVPKL